MSTWTGWHIGMTGPTVKVAKEKLKAHFSYAKALDDTEFFSEQLQFALLTYQTRKNMDGHQPPLRTDGVLDYNTQDALGMIVHESPELPVLFTVQGTGVDMWTGYPADTARALAGIYQWQPTGNYPASAFPMQPSIDQGRDELKLQLRNWLTGGRKGALAGYSQGAIVTSLVWKYDIANPAGELHDLLPNIIGAVTWGNPVRELGKANGNKAASWPIPEGMGIVDDRIVGTPEWWLDFAHGANSQWGRDLYTDNPNDAGGLDMTAVWHIVQNLDIGELIGRLGELLTHPVEAIPAALEALLYAGMFFLCGTGPHVDYDIDPAISHLRSIATTPRKAAA
jgi:hypothetical protein